MCVFRECNEEVEKNEYEEPRCKRCGGRVEKDNTLCTKCAELEVLINKFNIFTIF